MSEWTREKPTRPGWYWLSTGKSDPYIVEVYGAGDGTRLYVDDTPIAEFYDTCEWSGPLEPPSTANFAG